METDQDEIYLEVRSLLRVKVDRADMRDIITSSKEKNFYYALNQHHLNKGWIDAEEISDTACENSRDAHGDLSG